MLTLNLEPNKPQPIYMQIYQYIKNEILLHHLTPVAVRSHLFLFLYL